jgi:hypothetical protein
MPGSKPEILIDLDSGVGIPFTAETYLSQLKPGRSHHEQLDTRHPLGIYNVSVARILKKLTRCCYHLEDYLHAAPSVTALQHHTDKQDQVIDYVELSLYAAAEHVDDLEAIARCFFKDDQFYSGSKEVRSLKSSMKPIRDQISAFTNAIKHKQSRIRIFSHDIEQGEGSVPARLFHRSVS